MSLSNGTQCGFAGLRRMVPGTMCDDEKSVRDRWRAARSRVWVQGRRLRRGVLRDSTSMTAMDSTISAVGLSEELHRSAGHSRGIPQRSSEGRPAKA